MELFGVDPHSVSRFSHVVKAAAALLCSLDVLPHDVDCIIDLLLKKGNQHWVYRRIDRDEMHIPLAELRSGHCHHYERLAQEFHGLMGYRDRTVAHGWPFYRLETGSRGAMRSRCSRCRTLK